MATIAPGDRAQTSHAPEGYRCPFCAIARGEDALTTQDEVLLRDTDVTAFVPSHQWPNNRGHAVVIPNEHYENLYELPDRLAAPVHAAVRRLAVAMRSTYGCEGTSTRQHNEPAGNQDVWHYHVHVFPRYPGDRLYGSSREAVPLDVRRAQAKRLRDALRGGS